MPDALVSINQTYLNTPMANVLGFSNVQEDETWLQQFADAIRSDYVSKVIQNQVSAWTMDDITVSFIDGDHISYSVDVAFTVGPTQGTHVGQANATQLCLLVSLHYVGPKPNRGRVYFSGLSEDAITDGRWNIGVHPDYQDLLEGFVNGVGPAGNQAFLRIVRRPSAVFATYTSNPISLVISRDNPATQRRRRLRE